MSFVCSLFSFCTLSFLVATTPALALDNRCEALRRDLENKSLRLGEHLNAASKSNGRDDSEEAKAMISKIADLKEEILRLERELEACTDEKSAKLEEGLSTVRSEEGEYATKSCGDLRKRLVDLVKTVHSLRKRDNSRLSRLTPEEKREFRGASEQLKTVREALKSRCSAPTPPRPSSGDAKPANRN